MKKWIIPELDKKKVRELSARYELPVFTSMLLTIRGITEEEDIRRFFSYEPVLDDPFVIKDMDKAVERIKKAVVSYEKICIYGDYDCDGITSTAILYSYLESVFANVIYYIPDRNAEGYGMNMDAVNKLKEKDVKLIITVDNGISAVDEINYANELGMEVVVTDHHKPLDILPNAVAVVDPHRIDETSPFHDYCGAGLALKLITALEGNDVFIMENYSDLAAIGTVADIVPLKNENRSIVKTGLINLENSERVGINELISKAEIGDIKAGALGFKIGPRINASGRLGSPEDALSLLLTEDPDTASKKAELLDGLNSKRQSIEGDIFKEAERILEENPQIANSRILVLSSPGWNPGVIGIVSSRITEKYGKPSILIAEEDNVCKASGRSVEGFSLVDAVFECSSLLEKFGGHPMAVGFSIKKENIRQFTDNINAIANKLDYMPVAVIKLDTALNPEAIVLDMVNQLKEFEPFGCGNPTPVFAIKGAVLDRINAVGGGKHLKLSVSRGQARLTMMKFFTTPEEFPYEEGTLLDFAFTLDQNTYQGKNSISFIIKDIRLSERDFDTESIMLAVQDYELYRSGILKKHLCSELPSREDFKLIYVFLQRSKRRQFTIDSFLYDFRRFLEKIQPGVSLFSIFKILIILDIMNELHLIEYKRSSSDLYVSIRDVVGKVDIRASGILRKLKEDIKNA